MITTTASTGSFYVDDQPAEPLVLTLETEDDLSVFTSVNVSILNPSGTVAGTGTGTLVDDDDSITVTVDWPEEFTFTAAGVYRLNVSLVGASARLRLTGIPIVCQLEDGWHTLESARDEWPDADMDDLPLYELLQVTKHQCIVYGPALADDAPVPVDYKAAQLKQAQNTWNAAKTTPGTDFISAEGGNIPVFPMDWAVTNLLRPKTAIPVI